MGWKCLIKYKCFICLVCSCRHHFFPGICIQVLTSVEDTISKKTKEGTSRKIQHLFMLHYHFHLGSSHCQTGIFLMHPKPYTNVSTARGNCVITCLYRFMYIQTKIKIYISLLCYIKKYVEMGLLGFYNNASQC